MMSLSFVYIDILGWIILKGFKLFLKYNVN